MDGANITPRQVFGPIEATNALVGNNIFGSANISFNETLGKRPAIFYLFDFEILITFE